MLPLVRALRGRGSEGNPIPPVFVALEKLGARFRRGQLSLVAAPPGGGKTAFVTHWARHTGETVAYFSADTDSSTLAKRMVASMTGRTVDYVSRVFDEKLPELESYYAILKDKAGDIYWDFNRAPDINSILEGIKSYNYLYQEDPAIIVLDNLKNCDAGGDGDSQDHVRFDKVIDGLRQIAQKTQAHVCILHHVTGEYESGDKPVPLGGLLGKVSKDVRLCLTLQRVDSYLNASVVKNTSGKADAGGTGVVAAIPWDRETMDFHHAYDPSDPRPWQATVPKKAVAA